VAHDDEDRLDPETGEIFPPSTLDDVEDEGEDGDDEADGEFAGEHEAPVLLSLDTLMGDVRDALLGRLRTAPRVWAQMSEQEQRDTVEACSQTARHVVRGAVGLITNYEFPRAIVTLGQVTLKDRKTIEAKISTQNIEEYRSVLGEHVGTDVIVLAIDSETFMAARAEARIDKDQPNLPLED